MSVVIEVALLAALMAKLGYESLPLFATPASAPASASAPSSASATSSKEEDNSVDQESKQEEATQVEHTGTHETHETGARLEAWVDGEDTLTEALETHTDTDAEEEAEAAAGAGAWSDGDTRSSWKRSAEEESEAGSMRSRISRFEVAFLQHVMRMRGGRRLRRRRATR